jgi:feruloyl esterase
MTTLRRIAAAGGFAGLLWAAHVSNVLSDNRPIGCTEVAGTVTGSPGVKSATSAIVPPSGPNMGYCKVNILYGTSADQNINVIVHLPLNRLDGGAGGVEGAWNGRTQGLGGGVCSGNTLAGTSSAAVTNDGYVASGTDGGHVGGSCEAGVNPDGTYNFTFINDFFHEGMKRQVLFSKSVAATYYGVKPAYNYWNGCSTGGRQGLAVAQDICNEIDGVLANAPAIYWTPFALAQKWGPIVMKDLVGAPISSAKLNFATSQAVAACDATDGIADGIIDDPRTCAFSATALICVANGGPSSAASCLTPAEAEAIDTIWDGPRNASGAKVWFGLDRGTSMPPLNGPVPFYLTEFRWAMHDRNFDWRTVTMFGAGGTLSYADVAHAGSTNRIAPGMSLADNTGTVGNLDTFKKHGGKLISFVGTNDQLIYPRGVIKYYREMAARYGKNPNDPDFETLQDFYRLFRAPGVGHCGGGAGPQPQNLFNALVNWVENGVAPDSILASGGSAAPATGRTRLLCPYPQTAVYNGYGSTDDAANFQCGGNIETPATVCQDILAKYKHENEVDTPIDYRGTGVNRNVCGVAGN